MLQRVQAVVASVLGNPVEPQQPLMEAGLDSLGALVSILVCISHVSRGSQLEQQSP